MSEFCTPCNSAPRGGYVAKMNSLYIYIGYCSRAQCVRSATHNHTTTAPNPMNCSRAVSASNQAEVNKIIGGCWDGTQTLLSGPLSIVGYTGKTLSIDGVLNQTESDNLGSQLEPPILFIEHGIIITESQNLQSLSVGGLFTVILATFNEDPPNAASNGLLLENLSNLTSINVTSIAQTTNFTLRGLPKLKNMPFGDLGIGLPSPHIFENGTLAIEQTALESFQYPMSTFTVGSTRYTLSLANVTISNNGNLADLTLQTLRNVTGVLTVAGASTMSVKLEALQLARDMSLSGVAELSVPELQKVQSNLTFFNSSLSLAKAPALTSVTGSLRLQYLMALTSMSFPLLRSIGGMLQVSASQRAWCLE